MMTVNQKNALREMIKNTRSSSEISKFWGVSIKFLWHGYAEYKNTKWSYDAKKV